MYFLNFYVSHGSAMTSVTLNDFERRNKSYFALFRRIQ